MMLASTPLDPKAVGVISVYILSMLLIGWWGYRARRENTLRDFYLAGKGFGFFVLVFTLFATQYSGNTMIGFTGKTYRIGYAWIMCLHFMTAIIVFYLLFAPRLHCLAKKEKFITPVDFLQHRFGSTALNLVASTVLIVALGNYLLSQLMAIGRALEGLATDNPKQAYLYGVVILAIIMVIYESLGGLRAVAWTDVIQGAIMTIGFIFLVVLIFQKFGGLGTALEKIMTENRTDTLKVMPPPASRCREWFSYIFLVGMGGALYPQAIQRIYAAGSLNSLRRSLGVMAFLPLLMSLLAVTVGIITLANFPGLSTIESDRALMVISREIQSASQLGYWVVVFLFAALLAAIMSTADSALLSISSMITKDIYAGIINKTVSEQQLTRMGKGISWIVVAIIVILAIALREKATIVSLLDRKFDLLVQLVPAFFLGIRWQRLQTRPTLYGLLIGLTIAITLAAAGHGKLLNIHAGLWALTANAAIAIVGSLLCNQNNINTSNRNNAEQHKKQ